MSPELERLIQLQHLESAIAEARAHVAAHPQRLAEADARLAEADRVVEEATQHLKDAQEARRTLEKDAAVYQGRLTKFKDQLASVKTNREYTAMQHEIETAQKDLGAAEEKVLERMMEIDQLTAELKTAETAKAAAKKAVTPTRPRSPPNWRRQRRGSPRRRPRGPRWCRRWSRG
jgi:predicted  nucleic acid-binding Zn-ribbon protein